jgi:hypothetical protein
MQGEFRADVTRDTFDELKQIRRVLFQQGRVLLDADVNQQVSILLNYIEKLATDLIGPHGGPGNKGFEISEGRPGDPLIGIGRYYVDGVLCENNQEGCSYTDQPDYKTKSLSDGKYLMYLDAFEQYRLGDFDVALQGVDTSAHARLVWQVKAMSVGHELSEEESWVVDEIVRHDPNGDVAKMKGLMNAKKPIAKPELIAKTQETTSSSSPCEISPESRYRGPENQLYRVEIHRSGKVGEATFKWSRENSSVSFPVVGSIAKGPGPTTVTVVHLGRDAKLGLTNGDWVEVITEDDRKSGNSGQLRQVLRIDRDELHVTLNGDWKHSAKDAVLVRWDHQGLQQEEGEIQVEEDKPIILEDGITIEFVKPKKAPASEVVKPKKAPASWYRAGDYWLIPARVATGNVEWPKENGEPKPQYPHGVLHHYAPLAFITVDPTHVTVSQLLRKTINGVAQP